VRLTNRNYTSSHNSLNFEYSYNLLCLNSQTVGCTSCTVNTSSAVAEMGDSGHNRNGPKRGEGILCTFRGEAGSPSNTMWPGLLLYQVASSTSQPFCHIDMGQTLDGGCEPAPLFLGELGPQRTQSHLGRDLPPYQLAS